MEPQTIQMMVGIITGAIATFCAIMLWPRTRDVAWMLVIVGTIIHYGAVIFQALELFGVARIHVSDEFWSAIIRSIFYNAPFLFYSIGFIVMIRRKTGY